MGRFYFNPIMQMKELRRRKLNNLSKVTRLGCEGVRIWFRFCRCAEPIGYEFLLLPDYPTQEFMEQGDLSTPQILKYSALMHC